MARPSIFSATTILTAALVFGVFHGPGPAYAEDPKPYPGTKIIETPFTFAVLLGRLEKAIAKNGMFVVTRASASAGAKRRGIKIAGNMVLGVYRNDFAVTMLKASVAAGIEAPLRFYVTESADGAAALTYRTPSSVFAPYRNAPLDTMAARLDAIWAKIVAETLDTKDR